MTEKDLLIRKQRQEIAKLKEEVDTLKKLQRKLIAHVPDDVLGQLVYETIQERSKA